MVKIWEHLMINRQSFFFGQTNPWVPYVGDCKALETFLATKDGWGWVLPKFISALLRGVGQVTIFNIFKTLFNYALYFFGFCIEFYEGRLLFYCITVFFLKWHPDISTKMCHPNGILRKIVTHFSYSII